MIDSQRNPTAPFGSSEPIPTNPTPTVSITYVPIDYSHNSALLTEIKLNGHNYLEWALSVKLAIGGKGKIGHLIREISKPVVGDPNLKKW